MTFKNKRILLICRESYAFPFYYLALEWLKNNEVAFFYVKASETKFNKNLSNETSFYKFNETFPGKVYTLNSAADEFTDTIYNDHLIDDDYLRVIEKEYTHFLNVNRQLVISQSLNRHYHYRYFWTSVKYSQQLNWLILNYKHVIEVFDDYEPDIVLGCDNEELGHCVIREVCYARNIPNICIDYPRYETYKTFSYNLGLSVNKYFKDSMVSLTSPNNNDSLMEEQQYIQNFRQKSKIMHEMYQNDATSQYKADGLWKSLKFFVRVCLLLYKQDIIASNFFVKRANPVIFPSTSGYIKYFLKILIKKQYLMRRNKYFSPPIEGEKYVYMPLHLIPESTTFALAPFYVNELTIIEAVSKSLPAGWVLYVKEHQSMVGERELSFYRLVNRLPNVKMIQLNYYTDPKPWIEKSQGVVTISGTTAYEAALLGKHALVFSDVPFSLIKGVSRVRSFEDLPKLLSEFKNPLENIMSCAAYIRTVKRFGKPIDIKYILKKSEKYIKENITPDQTFVDNLRNLDSLFYMGYKEYNNNENY